MTTPEKLRQNLHQLVKMDYGFDIFRMDGMSIQLSFYHLGSVYNAIYSAVYFSDEWKHLSVNWQYARKNQKAAKYAADVVECLIQMQGTADDIAETEVAYYKALSDKIFEAKYSTQVDLHTWRGVESC